MISQEDIYIIQQGSEEAGRITYTLCYITGMSSKIDRFQAIKAGDRWKLSDPSSLTPIAPVNIHSFQTAERILHTTAEEIARKTVERDAKIIDLTNYKKHNLN